MSFRQPGLSLYDILDAVASQPIRSQQAQRKARQQADCAESTGYPFVTSIPAYNGYYYSVPRQGSYYEPAYFVNAEELPNEEKYARQQQTRSNPYTSRASSGGSLPSLIDLLQAVIPPAAYYGEADDDEEHETKDVGSSSDVGAGAAANAATEEAHVAKQDSKADDSDQPETTDGETGDQRSSLQPSRGSKTAEQPLLKRKLSTSFVHPEGRSSVPDPLQVSKPELRLDLPFSPEVNVYDADKEYVVVLALPGANSKSFSVDYHPSSHELQITGTVDNKKLNLDPRLLKISELKSGAFERTIKFPALPRLRDEEIKASYSNGLLQIKVPKILNDSSKPKPKRRIVIEDLPDEELEFEKNPNPVEATLD